MSTQMKLVPAETGGVAWHAAPQTFLRVARRARDTGTLTLLCT